MENKQIDVAFGNFLRQGREQRGLLQQDVADRVNLSQSYYARIESGQRSCYFSTALAICNYLNLDINEFDQANRQKETP